MRLALGQRLRSGGGLARSLIVYWRPGRQKGLRRLYHPFIVPGDFAFDIGAHLGDRSAAFQALGARVVALEPQPALARWFRRLIKHDDITLLPVAAGVEPGHAEIAISSANPTLSTLAHDWRGRIGTENPAFKHIAWERTLRVEVTTMDRLIERFGMPCFIKIDVEGFEAEVLKGLSHAVAALSVEFVAGVLHVSHACIEEITRLGDYRFNAIAGEQRAFRFATWQTPSAIRRWLDDGADGLASGDLYACRVDHPVVANPV
ncbi:FkbM family methyltransferase [Halomonas sp. GD1P12]|uniref:FkbM family methyltransferase n=1 Tax=Halomonas sp. GD1P12 TaxID=2982691 RepID=UPI0021E4ECF3|nr:FkbM family methyltransferase [Halomonas sp. GD1P12]UYG00877.1 FkbM family methyltransferase [Halomonas sp. GD1P12]